MKQDLLSQTVIITGASAGVGEATARHLAKKSANLILVARNKRNLELLANQLKGYNHIRTVSMDVSNYSDCLDLVERVVSEFSHIDILINNAGNHARGAVLNNKALDLAKMIDVNLKAPIVLSRLVLPHMKRENSAIINVASLAGRTPVPGSAVYSATKSGLRAFTYSLANEIQSKNIKIAVVSPGPIDTSFIMGNIDDVSDITFSQKISTVDEVAEVILDLCVNKKIEQAVPRISGFLTNLTYLFPKLAVLALPFLEKKGKRMKEKLKIIKSK